MGQPCRFLILVFCSVERGGLSGSVKLQFCLNMFSRRFWRGGTFNYVKGFPKSGTWVLPTGSLEVLRSLKGKESSRYSVVPFGVRLWSMISVGTGLWLRIRNQAKMSIQAQANVS